MSNVKGLSELISRLQKLQTINNDEIATKIAEHGAELAQGKYLSGDILVNAESLGNGTAKIVANGDKVAFYEYGVGTEGQNSYQGTLPTDTITFMSAGEMHSTKGWEYNYPNSKTKRNVGGSVGWFYNGEFNTGQAAQAQMWRTSNELEESEIANAIDQYLKEKGV